MDLKSEFDKQKEDRLLSGPAKRLMEKLKPLSSNVEAYQKRWFWELLQNACDYNQNVKIQVEVTKTALSFRHNGRPFTAKDAMNLIFPDSSKDEEQQIDVIGQFGTGFLSTHILSSKIKVKGILVDGSNDKYSFCFNLDRSAYDNKTALAEALSISEKELLSYTEVTYNDNEFQTEFIYEANSSYAFVNFIDTVNKGIEFIKKAIPFVFTFVPQLDEVSIKIGDKKYIFTRLTNGEQGCLYNKVVNEESSSSRLLVYSAKHENTQVAIGVEDNTIVNDEMPRLFCAYPMLGTEKFPFPCVINNPGFVPKTERDGVDLSENDIDNRSIIEEATKAYTYLLKQLCENKILSIYNVCHLIIGTYEGKIQDWYKKNVIDNLKGAILDNEIVSTHNGNKKLKDVLFPYPDSEESFDAFYTLCQQTNLIIPIQQDAIHWYEQLNFSIFNNNKLDIKELVRQIKTLPKKNIDESLKNEINEFDWLADLLKYIIDFEHQNLMQTHALIPVKNGKLKTSKQDFFWDNEISQELKIIYSLLHKDSFDEILLHTSVESLGDKLCSLDRAKNNKDISESIDQVFKSISSAKITAEFIEALQKLFTWTDNIPSEQQNDLFPIFSVNKARLMLETLGTDHERNIAFEIIKSDKKEILSRIASSSITKNELELLIENQDSFKEFLNWKNSIVNDDDFADENLGNVGEQIVFDFLKRKYDGYPEYSIEWVAKTRLEPNYDFEVKKNGKAWLFIDAKTTNQGIANSDSVPFFMRRGQWEFLPTLDSDQSYYVARVFIESSTQNTVKFLKINFEQFN